jgi:hypothetical protein
MTNKYLEKVAEMLKVKGPPLSERAAKRPKRIKKPKLRRFHVPSHNYK